MMKMLALGFLGLLLAQATQEIRIDTKDASTPKGDRSQSRPSGDPRVKPHGRLV